MTVELPVSGIPVNSPEIITKNLALNWAQGTRKVRISSNFLRLMGFEPGLRVAALPNSRSLEGFTVVPDAAGPQKVYSRAYNRQRGNKPLEALVEFGGQKLLDQCLPRYTERFHAELRHGKIVITPMPNRVHAVHTRFQKTSPWNALVALTGGVDIDCMESLGWKAEIVLEHRPSEARDRASGRDLSEVHALNTLVNSSPRILLNEDIHSLSIPVLERLLDAAPAIGLCHYSLGCDDHSTAKSKTAKDRSVEDLSTMVDMVYPMLKQVETIQPVAVLVENVVGFQKSGAGQILRAAMGRMGYHCTEMALDARKFGGLQSRKRYYFVASIYPGFVPPAPGGEPVHTIRELITEHLAGCADVTDTKLLSTRKKKARAMPDFVTVDSTYCPTILKSQDRGISDGVYIEHEGRVYKPSEDLLKGLLSIPDTFRVDWMAKEQATETLGQSVDYRMHHAVMDAVTEHIWVNVGHRTVVKHGLAN